MSVAAKGLCSLSMTGWGGLAFPGLGPSDLFFTGVTGLFCSEVSASLHVTCSEGDVENWYRDLGFFCRWIIKWAQIFKSVLGNVENTSLLAPEYHKNYPALLLSTLGQEMSKCFGTRSPLQHLSNLKLRYPWETFHRFSLLIKRLWTALTADHKPCPLLPTCRRAAPILGEGCGEGALKACSGAGGAAPRAVLCGVEQFGFHQSFLSTQDWYIIPCPI